MSLLCPKCAKAARLAPALVALVLGVTWVADPAASLAALGAFVLSAVFFVVLFVIEFRVAEPIIPFFTNRSIVSAVALSAIIGIGLFSVVAYLPTYFQMAYGTSATVSGLVPIATVFGMLIANLVTGTLASRTGRYRAYPILGTSLATTGLLVMGLLPHGLALWVPAVVMFVVGLGTGCFMSLIFAIAQSAAPRSELGAITASTNLVRQIGATTATAVIGSAIGFGVASRLPAGLDVSSLTPDLVHASPVAVQTEVAALYHDVFGPIFLVLAAVYAVGILAAILLPAGTLSDRLETGPVESQPAPSRTEPAPA